MVQRISSLEKRLAANEARPLGTVVQTKELTLDTGTEAAIKELARPIKILFNSKGLIIGAKRVDFIDVDDDGDTLQ